MMGIFDISAVKAISIIAIGQFSTSYCNQYHNKLHVHCTK